MRTIFRGYSSDVVAQVGNTDITLKQFEREFDNQTKAMSQRAGQPLTREQARAYGVPQASLTRLIALAALDSGAKDLGLAASDETVAKDIAADPNLQGSFGKFDRAAFQMALQRVGLTEKAFIADRRAYIERATAQRRADEWRGSALLPSRCDFHLPAGNARRLLHHPAAGAPWATSRTRDEKTLEAYHKKAAIHFTQPETRDFTIMTLEPSDLASSITISDADLAKAYEQRRSEFDIPEKRTIDQIPFATKEAAAAADAAPQEGRNARQDRLRNRPDAGRRGIGHPSHADQMVSPAVADAAFALKIGEYSEPVQGPLGNRHSACGRPSSPARQASSKR